MSEPLKDLSKNELVREVQRLRALLAQQMAAAPGIGDEVVVEGIVSSTSGKPIVVMRAGEVVWQMTPAKAREHAYAVIGCAVEAERDAATLAYLLEMDAGASTAGAFLAGMREHRQQWIATFHDAGA